jgi:hypothetical protein
MRAALDKAREKATRDRMLAIYEVPEAALSLVEQHQQKYRRQIDD